jgi:hypothetical protein
MSLQDEDVDSFDSAWTVVYGRNGMVKGNDAETV